MQDIDRTALVRSHSAAGTWTLDPAASRLQFSAKTMWGLMTVRGELRAMRGEAVVDEDGNIRAHLEVDSASLDTGQSLRDRHLRSADFFNVSEYPRIDIEVDPVTLISETAAQGTAQVTVAGRTQQIGFDATITLSPDSRQAVVETSFVVDRRGFGMTWNLLGIVPPATEVSLHLVYRHDVDS